MKNCSALALVVILSFPALAADLREVIPESGLIEGDILVLASPPELEQLVQIFQTAAENNQEWFLEYVAQYETSADPLPYHSNFGLSVEEYDRFLELSEKGLSLQSVASINIQAEVADDGSITFKTDPADFPLNNISLYPDNGYVETVYGRLDSVNDVNQQDPDSPTGRWTASQWAHEEFSGDSGWGAKLAIGKRTDFRDGIIYYDVNYQMGPEPHQISFIILYPLDK